MLAGNQAIVRTEVVLVVVLVIVLIIVLTVSGAGGHSDRGYTEALYEPGGQPIF